jgi:molecular chaperone IbpA
MRNGPVRASADTGALLVPMLLKEDMVMRNAFDFTPFARSSIGFDHLFDLLNNPQLTEDQGGYPPYDIVRTSQDSYRIAVAVAGFKPEEITVTSQQNLLTVQGQKAEDDAGGQYLHRGISARAFMRRFNLEDHVEVEKADYQNGLLQIDLVRRIPEAMKPRKIPIASGAGQQTDNVRSINAA